MSAALTAPSTAAASAREAAERYLDRLRDHQQRYLEAAGAAAAEVRGVGQLEHLAASTLQLSRQFFDAQRAIVGRVGRHQADLLECHAGDDLLDLAAWDAGAATRQLAALLDGWWAALNSDAGKAIDEAAARRALVQQVDRIEQTHVARQPYPSTSSTSTASSMQGGQASPSPLPLAVRSLLERADGSDLRSLLRDLGSVLRSSPTAVGAVSVTASRTVAPVMPAAFPPPTVRHAQVAPVAAVAAPAREAERDLRFIESPCDRVGGPAVDESLTRLERFEQDRRHFWNEADVADERDGGSWFPTPAVVSIATATAALTAVLALIG